MKDLVNYITESNQDQEYIEQASAHIIKVLQDHGVDFDKDFDKEDETFNYYTKFKTTIKKFELDEIDKELRKVLGCNEVSAGKKINSKYI